MIKVSKAVPWAVLDNVGTGLLGLLALTILTRLLSAADFGAVTVAQSIVALIQTFSSFGMIEAIVQRRLISASHLDSAFWSSLGLGILSYAACLGIAGFYWNQDSTSVVPYLLVVEGLACILSGANLVPAAMLDRSMQTKVIAKRTLAGKLAYCFSAIGLTLLGAGPWSIICASLVQNVITTIVLWSGHNRWPRFRFSWRHILELSKFGLPIMLESALWAFLTRIFNLMVGSIHGLVLLGYMNVAIRSVDAFKNVLIGISTRIALPFFSSLQDNAEKLTQAFKQGTELVTLVSTPALTGLVLTASDWVPLIMGEKWISAIPLITIVCITWIISLSRQLVGPYLRSIGKPHVMLLLGFCAAAVTILSVFATANQSIVVVMLGWSARIIITIPVGIYLLKKFGQIGVIEQILPLAKPFLCTAVMVGTVSIWRFATGTLLHGHALSLAASIFIGTLSYLAVTAFVYHRHIIDLLDQRKDRLSNA